METKDLSDLNGKNIKANEAVFIKDIDDVSVKPNVKLIGLTKEQLEQYRNDPFWKTLRNVLICLFWIIWFAMLIGAVCIVIFSKEESIKINDNTVFFQVEVDENNYENIVQKLGSLKDFTNHVFIATIKNNNNNITDKVLEKLNVAVCSNCVAGGIQVDDISDINVLVEKVVKTKCKIIKMNSMPIPISVETKNSIIMNNLTIIVNQEHNEKDDNFYYLKKKIITSNMITNATIFNVESDSKTITQNVPSCFDKNMTLSIFRNYIQLMMINPIFINLNESVISNCNSDSEAHLINMDSLSNDKFAKLLKLRSLFDVNNRKLDTTFTDNIILIKRSAADKQQYVLLLNWNDKPYEVKDNNEEIKSLLSNHIDMFGSRETTVEPFGVRLYKINKN